MAPHEDDRRPLEALGLALIALAMVALHATCLTRYGWFRDELYYLSCAKRLAWGYVDHPPFSIAVLAALRAVAGESLVAMRLVSALAEAHFFSMNAFNLVFWALATLLALRAIGVSGAGSSSRASARAWLAFGLVLGVGLLDKWSMAWLGAGVAVALVASPARRALLTPWPWLAALLAGAILAPNLVWEARHGFPTLEFMHNASTQKMRPLDLMGLLRSQLLVLGPGAALLWIAGFFAALVRREWRPVAIIWLVTLVLLASNGSARAGYLALAAPALFAAGAAWWEERGAMLRGAVLTLALALSVPLIPLALPILPVPRLIAWQRVLGQAPRSEERQRMGPLAQHQADMFGWPELADSVARVTASLSVSERAGAIVRTNNYGEAGALEHFGAGRVPNV